MFSVVGTLKSYTDSMFDFLDKNRVRCNVSFSDLNSFRLGGNAKFVLDLHNSEVPKVLSVIENKMPFVVIGLGCNVLVSDSGFDGVVIRLIDSNVSLQGSVVQADAGAPLQRLLNVASHQGLSGLEWAAGLPSTVGGAVYGNAGARGFCIGDVLIGCQVLQKGAIMYLDNDKCGFEYRKSAFVDSGDIVLKAWFGLEQSTVDKVKQNLCLIKKMRNNPKGLCAGSVFKNGTDYTAGQLIDSCGLKGCRVGGAFVSEQHANFVVNDGTASSKDVYDLISTLKQKVFLKYGIQLQLEIRLIGKF